MKTCIKCGQEKPESEFALHSGTGRPRNECKACQALYQKKYRQKNLEDLIAYDRQRAMAPHRVEARRKYQEEHRDEYLAYCKRKYQRRKPIINQQLKERRGVDPTFRLLTNMRTRLVNAVKGHTKAGHTTDLVGCSRDQLVSWLEAQFTPEMSWENYGTYWHVDHIKPCIAFDLSDPQQQKECFYYTNLRPLTVKENLSRRKYQWEL